MRACNVALRKHGTRLIQEDEERKKAKEKRVRVRVRASQRDERRQTTREQRGFGQ
jgi:hypothetical protein